MIYTRDNVDGVQFRCPAGIQGILTIKVRTPDRIDVVYPLSDRPGGFDIDIKKINSNFESGHWIVEQPIEPSYDIY